MSSLRIFVDADVLFCGAAAPNEHAASHVILRMAEITLIEALISEQVLTEVERNLAEKVPQALPAFRLLIDRTVKIVRDPTPDELVPHAGAADVKDLPILVAAAQSGCPYLVTFNLRHHQLGHPRVAVVRPGDLVLTMREHLVRLNPAGSRRGRP